ncbi:MAG: hypothetical protein LBC41_02455 [Clostridiales bacterium]|jgi:P4 family phage/plasmid primase-like protien|nr:hypothetical protein [Clostridiales bacterium]MDR2749498.1 hypothetical protein [Clostridiales bacterium]
MIENSCANLDIQQGTLLLDQDLKSDPSVSNALASSDKIPESVAFFKAKAFSQIKLVIEDLSNSEVVSAPTGSEGQASIEIPLGSSADASLLQATVPITIPKFLDSSGKIDREFFSGINVAPCVLTSAEQGNLIALIFGPFMKYSPPDGFLVFNGIKWIKDKGFSNGMIQSLVSEQISQTRKSLEEVQDKIKKIRTDLLRNSVSSHLATEARLAQELRLTEDERSTAEKRHASAIRMGGSFSIGNSLVEARAIICNFSTETLNWDPYKLNTPAGTVDLRTGMLHPHDPADLITNVTAWAPSDVGIDKWLEFLGHVTGHDKELESFIQIVAGKILVGKTDEFLVVANGEESSGKRILFRIFDIVLNDYSCTISPDVVSVQLEKRIDRDLEALRGKRLVLSEEPGLGKRLDANVIKLLTTSSSISAKVKRRVIFEPSHTAVFLTDKYPIIKRLNLPLLRKIIEIPFPANYSKGNSHIRAQVLCDNAGGAIMQWMIDGAIRYVGQGCDLGPLPKCVDSSTSIYRDEAAHQVRS